MENIKAWQYIVIAGLSFMAGLGVMWLFLREEQLALESALIVDQLETEFQQRQEAERARREAEQKLMGGEL